MGESVRILVTGRLWAGAKGARTTGPVLFEMMSGTRQELIMVAYRFTIAVPALRDAFEKVLARGCRVKLIIDSSGESNPNETRYFRGLTRSYSNIEIWDFLEKDTEGNPAQLHAKIVVSDRRLAVIGSANFSKNGLVENHELGIQIAGKPVTKLCDAIDQLLQDGQRAGIIRLRRSA